MQLVGRLRRKLDVPDGCKVERCSHTTNVYVLRMRKTQLLAGKAPGGAALECGDLPVLYLRNWR